MTKQRITPKNFNQINKEMPNRISTTLTVFRMVFLDPSFNEKSRKELTIKKPPKQTKRTMKTGWLRSVFSTRLCSAANGKAKHARAKAGVGSPLK